MKAMRLAQLLTVGLCLACAIPAGARELPIGKCVNAGNHLEGKVESRFGGKRIEPEDFRAMRAAGFETVRIPVNWYTHSDPAAPHEVDPQWMTRVTEVVDSALASGLNVILNSHNFAPVHDDPAVGGPWLADVWRQVARNFADRPQDRLWFEIENEPHDKLDNANLLATLTPALAAIRESNPTRAVVIGGERWSGIDSLATLRLPDDPNVYPTFHYYEPFDFTHQGATWVSPSPPLGRKYGTEADAARLTTDIAKLRAYVARTGVTPFMGESGAFESIPLAGRLAYYRAITQAFTAENVPICYWAYTNTFPLRDKQTGKWLDGMLDAVGLSKK